MSPQHPGLRTWIAAAALTLSSAALAGGTHAGGHTHDHGHSAESAIGKPGAAKQVKRTISIEMSDDMRFTPANIQVKQGETVRFVVKNIGQARHEMNLGTEQELMAHLEEMKQNPDMAHDDPNKITLEPGKQGEIIWQFTKAGTVPFACLLPGHHENGMKGQIKVRKK